MVKTRDSEGSAWPGPQFSEHPPVRVGAPLVDIGWSAAAWPVHLRVRAYTCSCRDVAYELVSGGGQYLIRRVRRGDPAQVLHAGPWTRAEAERIWNLILTGAAR